MNWKNHRSAECLSAERHTGVNPGGHCVIPHISWGTGTVDEGILIYMDICMRWLLMQSTSRYHNSGSMSHTTPKQPLCSAVCPRPQYEVWYRPLRYTWTHSNGPCGTFAATMSDISY